MSRRSIGFFEPSDFDSPAVAASYAVVLVNSIGVAGCVFLLALFLKNKNLHNTPNYMVMSLAWADFALQLTHLIVNSSVLAKGKWSYSLCQMSGWTASYFGGTSLDGLSVLALERFFATARERPLNVQKATLMIGFTWVIQLICATIPYMLGKHYEMEPSGIYCMAKYTANLPAWAAFTLISLASIAINEAIIVLCYYKIYQKVVDIKKLLKGVNHGGSVSGNEAKMSTTKNVAEPEHPGIASANVSLSASLAGSFRFLLRGMSGTTTATPSPNSSGNAGALACLKAKGQKKNDAAICEDIRDKPSLANSATGKEMLIPASGPTDNRGRKPSSVLRSLNLLKRKKANDRRLETVLFRKSIIITGVFTVFWSPYLIAIAYQLITNTYLPSIYHTYASLCVYCNSMLNPYLYILLDTRWKKAAYEMLGIEMKKPAPPPVVARKPVAERPKPKKPAKDIDDL